MRHCNIPVFIPHLGCPNQCVFCNQRSISGCTSFCEAHVPEIIDEALSTIPVESEIEIAFFGGSFTGIDRGLMIRLLEIGEHYVRDGRVQSMRLSTRPDYITPEILELLSRYSVRVIELGLQSMNDEVLKASERGHTARQAEAACRAVVGAGFRLVGQMMIGLPSSSEEDEIETAKRIASLGATAARIYPTVVFRDTSLARMTEEGSYTPLSLEDAVRRSASVLEVFEENNIPCIRIGLCAGEELVDEKHVIAGPNHAALGELVRGEVAYRRLLQTIRAHDLVGKEIILRIPPRELSYTVGQHRCNIERLLRETDTRVRKIVGDESIEKILPLLWQRQEENRTCI